MADIAKLMEEIKGMTVIELSNFVKALEEEFGVSAAAPVAAGAAAGAPAAAVFLSEGVWPLNVRVGANSPSLCPTMSSVTYTGTC